MKLPYVIEMHKNMFPIKKKLHEYYKGLIIYRLTQIFFDTLRHMTGNILKAYFNTFYSTKYNKLLYFIEMYKSMFHIQDHTKEFWYTIGYAWKRLEIYFQLCFTVCF